MLKKILLVVIIMMMLACKQTVVDDSKANMHKYESYYQSILDNDTFFEKSESFSIEAVMNQVGEYYRFSVILDSPKIAMFDIEMMAIIDDGSVSVNYDKVMPASGVFDRSYNLIPYQQNEAAGYPRGIILDGLCDKAKIDLLVMVSWRNEDSSIRFKEFFHLQADIDSKKP